MKRAGWMAVAGLAVFGGCSADAPTRPDRKGAIESIVVGATVLEDGAILVSYDVTFVSDDGGEVPLRAPVLAAVRTVTLDGGARNTTASSGSTVHIRAPVERTVVKAVIDGAVERYGDIAVVTIPVWSVPSDAGAGDPLVPVRGQVAVPGTVVAGTVHWHTLAPTNVDPTSVGFVFDGRVVMDENSDLVFALPAAAVPGALVLSDEQRLPYFTDRQTALDAADARLADELDDRARADDVKAGIYWAVVGAEVAIPILVVLWRLVRAGVQRRRAVAGVPDSLIDPPDPTAPAVVALLANEGKDIGGEALAGAILGLAQRELIVIDGGVEGRYRITIPPSAEQLSPAETALVGELHRASQGAPLEGPPLAIDGDGPWWKLFRRATVGEAKVARLLQRRYPSGVFVTATVLLTITTLPLWARTPEAAAAGIAVAGILCMLPFVGGYQLTPSGHRKRAQWEAFGRHARDHSEIGSADPGGIVIWGPYLAYGAALGLARESIHALSPGGKVRQTLTVVQ